jgi:hypothetical protein
MAAYSSCVIPCGSTQRKEQTCRLLLMSSTISHPEWRAELRRLVLTDELLALPEQVGVLTEQMTALTVQVTALARSV